MLLNASRAVKVNEVDVPEVPIDGDENDVSDAHTIEGRTLTNVGVPDRLCRAKTDVDGRTCLAIDGALADSFAVDAEPVEASLEAYSMRMSYSFVSSMDNVAETSVADGAEVQKSIKVLNPTYSRTLSSAVSCTAV